MTRSLHEDLYPILVVGDVDDAAGKVDRAEELVQIDPELRKVPAHETARSELHLADAGDRERDRDVDLGLAAFGDADAQDASPRTGGRAGVARSRGRRRWWRRLRAVVDVAERSQQPIRLIAVDLALGEQPQDLLALLARHQPLRRRASISAAASSTPISPFASLSRRSRISSRVFVSGGGGGAGSASASVSASISSSSER